MNMKMVHLGKKIALAVALLLLSNVYAQAQSKTVKYVKETKMVRNCEYEVLRGLAEIKSVTKVKDKSESILGHDEYVVKFVFTPMEPGHALLPTLAEQEFELYLRSSNVRVPIGPEYIKHYNVIKGLKFAMQFLQSRNDCNDKWLYESKGLPNDLFEPTPENLDGYKKAIYEKKLIDAEEKHQALKSGVDPEAIENTPNPNLKNTDPNPNKNVNPETNPVNKEPVDTEVKNTENTNEGNVTENKETEKKIENFDEAALRAELEKKAREEAGLDNGSNRDSMRARIEREMREQFQKEQEANAKYAIADAKKNAKDEAKRLKEEERLKALEEAEKQKAIEAKKAEIEKEIQVKIQAEADAKKKKEQALRAQIEQEIRRESCTYKDKISGSIEVLSVTKIMEEHESVFGYAEYEVKYKFRPDNYNEIDKKDRKIWDEVYVFKIDPKGKSANPSATYIRKNQVLKGQKYKGFAQVMESGICEPVMIYAPEMPIGAEHVK